MRERVYKGALQIMWKCVRVCVSVEGMSECVWSPELAALFACLAAWISHRYLCRRLNNWVDRVGGSIGRVGWEWVERVGWEGVVREGGSSGLIECVDRVN